MPKHKKWIDKKHSKTFRLIHQSQNVDDCDGEQQSTGKKMNAEEYEKYGIYFDDGYNYLQHLKEVNGVTENGVEKSIIRAPSVNENLLTDVFEANGYEINADMLKMGIIPREMHVDQSLIAELADETEFENPTDDLDDDFVLQASGGELPVLHPPVSFSSRKNDFRAEEAESDEYSDEEMELDSDYNEEQMLEEEDMFVAVKNKGELRPVDEQFNKLCEEYSETDDEEATEIEKELLLDPNSDQMKMLAEDFKKKTVELVLQNDALAQCYPERNEEVERILCPERKKAKWDCETVVSAYSNIYNRPAVIVDSPHKKNLKSVLKQIEKMDCSVQSTTKSAISNLSSSTIRKRGETTEERKTRKTAIKMIRAERRAEKKSNKLAFREERKKAALGCRSSMIKMMPIV